MDAVSYSNSAKQAKRIKRFIENPDSNSGVLTQPKVIEAGETVTIKSGRQAILADTVVDGDLVIEAGGEVFILSGSSVDFSNGIKVNGEKLTMSIPTAYHIYNGSVEATNTVVTNGFSTTLYTGNGTTQEVITGVDMATQWGDDVSETFGGLIWFKNRSSLGDYILSDSVNDGFFIRSNTTAANTSTSGQVVRTSTGVSLGSDGAWNGNAINYASWNFQTTHRRTGVTNHGKAYTEHYNPFTGFTIIKYEGSGIAGHEIPHSLGRKLGFSVVKVLSTTENWYADAYEINKWLLLNGTKTGAEGVHTNISDTYVGLKTSIPYQNGLTNQYIMYGWANSYFDEDNKLIGNYEVGVYHGTGVSNNKVKTRGKPAWVMVKSLDAVEHWFIMDNQRNLLDSYLNPNTSASEVAQNHMDMLNDGFILNSASSGSNATGGQYLYMVVYDNDSGSGKSKYPKATDTTNLTINALVPYANGIDVNGSKVSIEYKNETITGLTLTEGKNYLYSKNDGTYDVSMIAPSYGTENPLTGDFFNLKTLKWYDSANDEITPRTYLDCVVHADHNGQVTYVEELPKIEYKDVIKANEYQGKNALIAYALVDMTTTPPTIKSSFNVSGCIRVASGIGNLYLSTPTDTSNVSAICGSSAGGTVTAVSNSMITFATGTTNYALTNIYVFGGQN